MKPWLKWPGGKTELAPTIKALMPRVFNRYIEPFVGGGGLFFSGAANGHEAWLADINRELVDCYRAVRDSPDMLIGGLLGLQTEYTQASPEQRATLYYAMRDVADGGPCRTIFLNKTCFNGLYRVNRSGKFNVPHGRTSSGEPPLICDAETIRACSAALQKVSLTCADFGEVASLAGAGDFCYFDCPYIPVSGTANFTAYAKGGFGPAHQARLAELCRSLARRGVHWIASNSDTPEARAFYEGFDVRSVSCRRSINCKTTKRQKVGEILVLSGTWDAPS